MRRSMAGCVDPERPLCQSCAPRVIPHFGSIICLGRAVKIFSNNLGVAEAINRKTASSLQVVVLLRQLVLKCLVLNVHFSVVYVPGVTNCIADSFSRFKWDRFRELVPEADEVGLCCPGHLWSLV